MSSSAPSSTPLPFLSAALNSRGEGGFGSHRGGVVVWARAARYERSATSVPVISLIIVTAPYLSCSPLRVMKQHRPSAMNPARMMRLVRSCTFDW